jgi:hypothetical protein
MNSQISNLEIRNIALQSQKIENSQHMALGARTSNLHWKVQQKKAEGSLGEDRTLSFELIQA